jgi:hypothetical protein
MCDNILALQESSKLEAEESSNKQRAHHLGLRLDNISPEKLHSFVEKYSPLQLVAERVRSKQNRLKLRKIVDNCGLMSSIAALVERTSTTSDASDDLQGLEAAVQIDKRLALPHPTWTSRHDAILIRAIFKHGWIDQSSSFRAIADDSSIKWGPPFELQEDMVPSAVPTNLDDSEGLRATALRAATFISKNRELIEEFKGFNHTAVKRAYGLVLSDEPDDTAKESMKHEAPQSHVWVVDDSALVGAEAESKGTGKLEPEDLPTAKDLLRRAKLLLSRCGFAPGAVPDSSRVNDRQGHDFAVLDQSDRCNIFLAELLRGLVKAKFGTKDNRKFCLAASQEATDRVKSIKALMVRHPSEASHLSKSLTDMSRIVQHLDVVLQNLQKSARQFKNVIRAILGLDLDPGRNPDEPMFPVAKPKPTNAFTKKACNAVKSDKKAGNAVKSDSSPGSGKRSTSKTDAGKSNSVKSKVAAHSPMPMGPKTTGEIAIENSQGKLWSRRSQGGPFLQLTEIEIRILAVACSKGLPVWNDKVDWVIAGGGGSGPSSSSAGRSRPYALTWAEFGRHVSEHARSMLDLQAAKVNRLEDDIATRPPDQLNTQVRYRLRVEESTRDVRERAFEQAEDYANEPETLAKKTLMMMSKVREMAVDTPPVASSSASSSSPNGTKGKSGVVGWLRDDLRRWGKSLDVSDETGDPFALTAVDFQDDVAEEERSAIEVSSVLNVDGCWGVLEQVALMSRLRSIFLSCERGAKQRILEGAVDAIDGSGIRSSSSSKKKWASQPEWWAAREGHGGQTTLHHDQLLLERLMHSGFDGVLLDQKSYGVGGDVVRARIRCGSSLGRICVDSFADTTLVPYLLIFLFFFFFEFLPPDRRERDLPARRAEQGGPPGAGVAARDGAALPGGQREVCRKQQQRQYGLPVVVPGPTGLLRAFFLAVAHQAAAARRRRPQRREPQQPHRFRRRPRSSAHHQAPAEAGGFAGRRRRRR